MHYPFVTAVFGGRFQTINEGQFAFLDSNVIHYMTAENKVKIYNFEFCLAWEDKTELMLARHLGKIASVTNFIRNLRTFGIFSDSANVLLVLKSIHAALADKTREILFRE